MQEPLRITVPSEKEIEKLLRLVNNVIDAVAKYGPNLTPQDRRHLLKPRPGGEKVSELVIRVADQRKLRITGASATAIANDRARATRLAPLKSAASSLLKSLADTILESESKAWWATTAYYTALQGVARSDGALKQELQPATSFFARRKSKKKTAPTTQTPSLPATSAK